MSAAVALVARRRRRAFWRLRVGVPKQESVQLLKGAGSLVPEDEALLMIVFVLSDPSGLLPEDEVELNLDRKGINLRDPASGEVCDVWAWVEVQDMYVAVAEDHDPEEDMDVVVIELADQKNKALDHVETSVARYFTPNLRSELRKGDEYRRAI